MPRTTTIVLIAILLGLAVLLVPVGDGTSEMVANLPVEKDVPLEVPTRP